MLAFAAQTTPSLRQITHHREISAILSFFLSRRHEINPPCPSPDVCVERRAAADVPLALLRLLILWSWSFLLVSGRQKQSLDSVQSFLPFKRAEFGCILACCQGFAKTQRLIFFLLESSWIQISTAGQRGTLFLSDVSGFCLTDIKKLLTLGSCIRV